MQVRTRKAIFSLLFLILLVVRLAASMGQPLHFDEPFWFLRSDFLMEELSSGDWEALQNRHWSVASTEGERRLFNSYIATGTGTALLTGVGRLMIPESEGGIDQRLIEIFLSRLFHAVTSILTPMVLLVLARGLGLPWPGRLFLLVYLIFDPVVGSIGSQAHLESFLTLTIPAALLLFAMSHRHNSISMCLLSGAVFGLAFANRINGAVVVIAGLAYVSLRLWVERDTSPPGGKPILLEAMRVGLLGLTGWAVFILCFPPLWSSPVLGFADFLYQQAALSGSGPTFDPSVLLWTSSSLRFFCVLLSLAGMFLAPVRSSRAFQIGLLLFLFGTAVVTLSGQFYERYLSSALPGLGLAAGCTVAWAVEQWRVVPRRWFGLLIGGLLLVCTASMVSITQRHWKRFKRVRHLYATLDEQAFSRVDVAGMHSSFVRAGSDPSGPALRLGSPHPQVELFQLGVLLTDGRRFHRFGPGWSRADLIRSECRPGDWRMAPLSRQNRQREEGIRDGDFIAWPCGTE